MGKEIVFSLVERGGQVRSQVVKSVSAKSLRPMMTAQIRRETALMTDDAGQYRILGGLESRVVFNHCVHACREHIWCDFDFSR